MLYFLLLVLLILVFGAFDVNYFLRTYFTVLTGRLYEKRCSLNEVTTIFGVCTLQDVDIWFRRIREARVIRELDFARYHFYERTGIYHQSKCLKIRSLQGCTLSVAIVPVPLFSFYKINTKLVYWDEKSLFFEHKVVTLRDGKTCGILVSRQHALGVNGESTKELLYGLPGSENKPICPDYIKPWFKSMEINSQRLRSRIK